MTSERDGWRIEAECPFCCRIKSFSIAYWLEHLTVHTGEYMYHCNSCQYRFASTSHHCPDNETREVKTFEAEENGIYGYICNTCNYVQLEEAAVISHTQTEHDPGSTHSKLKLVGVPNVDDEPNIKPIVRKENDIRNDNKDVHIMNDDYLYCCIVCDESLRYAVPHYVQHHSEVYVSRLTQSVYNSYTTAEPTSSFDGKEYEAMCPVCQSTRSLPKMAWIDHLTSHTGEYRYCCGRCKKRVLRQNDHISRRCGGKTLEKKIDIGFECDTHGIYAYVCKKCNYIQLGRDRLVLHLRMQHAMDDEMAIQEQYTRIMVVSMRFELADVPKNTNADVHQRNEIYRNRCMLCPRKCSILINHYVVFHPDAEVYHARLSPEMVAYCDKEPMLDTFWITDESKFEAMCLFCEENRMFEANRWIEHMTTHTGEYMHECDHCKHKFSAAAKSHPNCEAKEKKINRLYNFEFENNRLFGYMCQMCHYLQLNEENTIRHVTAQHDISEVEAYNHYRKIQILDLNAEGRVKKSALANVNPEMYLANPKYNKRCVACGENCSNLAVRHYVLNHSEVYLSRIAPDTMEKYRNAAPTSAGSSQSRYRLVCLFCETETERQRNDWIDHITTHTGEYQYQCVRCNHVMSTSRSHGKCNQSQVVKKLSFDLENGALFAYYCTMCNYIQLTMERCLHHIVTHHEIAEASANEYCSKYKLFQLEMKKRPHASTRRKSTRVSGNVVLNLTAKPHTPNTDIDMHPANKQCWNECALCHTQTPHLTMHYLKYHPGSEVYHSRISSQSLSVCVEGNRIAAELPNKMHEETCPFCEVKLELNRQQWHYHLVRHTGELPLQCKRCGRYIYNAKNHSERDKCSSKLSDFERLETARIDGNRINAYACMLCNYVQFRKQNIINHLQQQHEIDEPDIDTSVAFLKLIEFFGRLPAGGSGYAPSRRQASVGRVRSTNFVKLERNIDKQMYSANEAFEKDCQLCSMSFSHVSTLIKHCVVSHSTQEVYLSRLSEKMIVDGRVSVLKTIGTKSKGTEAFCVFCERYRVLQKSRWIEHLTSHTGEYQYDCQKCKTKVNSKREHTGPCDAKDIKRISYLELEGNLMAYAFVCKICNYVQFAEDRVQSHLREQHRIDADDVSNQYYRDKILDLTAVKGRTSNATKNTSKDIVQRVEPTYPLNDRMIMFAANPMYATKCPLCDAKSKKMHKHFNDAHPTLEFYLSRISPTVMECVRGNALPKGYQNLTDGKVNVFCVFCEDYVAMDDKLTWTMHLVRHTNEPLYECKKCEVRLFYKHTHVKRTRCPQYHIKEILEMKEDTSGISAYVCDMCNFMQFDEAHMNRHIELQHGIDPADVEQHRSLVLICNFDGGDQPDPEAERLRALCKAQAEQLAPPEIEQADDEESHNNAGNFVNEEIKQSSGTKKGEGSNIKNNDRNMYITNRKHNYENKCILCDFVTQRALVNHYVRMHPKYECFISRLSPKMMEVAVEHSNISSPQSAYYHEAQCLFCEKRMSKAIRDWHRHILIHTGEYLYGCKSCGQVNVRPFHGCCKNDSCQELWRPPKVNKKISGFACKQCNFVQCSEQAVIKHLRKNHDCAGSIMEMYSQITFVDFKEKSEHDPDVTAMMEVRVVLENCCPSTSTAQNDDNVADHSITEMNVPQDEAEMDDSNCLYEEMDTSTKITSTNDDEIVKMEFEVSQSTGYIDMDEFIAQQIMDEPIEVSVAPEIIEILSDDDDDVSHNAPSTSGTQPQPQIKTERPEEPLTILIDDSDDESPSSTSAPTQNMHYFNPPQIKTEPQTDRLSVIVKNERFDDFAPIKLKPWTNCSTLKNPNTSHQMLHDISLFALFKCMAKDCPFSCNSEEIIAEHLRHHEAMAKGLVPSADNIKTELADYLECAYCNQYLATRQELIDHTIGTHASSIFQCQHCFYRSIDAHATLTHERKYHPDRPPVILVCDGYNRSEMQNYMKELMEKQLTNVHPVECPEGKIF